MTAGTTGLGAIDPVHETCRCAARYGVRVHVDAAYGGFFRLIADDTRRRCGRRTVRTRSPTGDSVVVDPHKHGLQPYGCGAVLFTRSGGRPLLPARLALHLLHLRRLHLGEISLECSRAGAAAAALWLTLRLLPLTPDGLGRCCGPVAARRCAGRNDRGQLGAMALFQPPELDIVTYFPTAQRCPRSTAASAHVLDCGNGVAADEALFVATYTVDTRRPRPPRPHDRGGHPAGRILRSVLMKPETEDHVPRLHDQVLDLLAEYQQRPTE